MNNTPLLYGIGGFLLGSVLTAVLVVSVFGRDSLMRMPMMGAGSGFESAPRMHNLDKHFIEHMIPHHDGAIEMAELAKQRSERPEILNLADEIIRSQTEENLQMRNWYKDWYGAAVPENPSARMEMGRGMMHGGMMGDSTSDIESLKNAENFDTAFLKEMIPHHQMAVMMAQMLRSGTDRPELQQLADEIIAAQDKEIEQMQVWLGEWE